MRLVFVLLLTVMPFTMPSIGMAANDDCWEDPWMRAFCEMERKKR